MNRPRLMRVCLWLCLLPVACPADIQLDAQVGFDPQTPLVRANAWSPVTATLRNNGPNLDGVLRLRARGSGQSLFQQEHPLALPKNSTKQVRDVVFLRDGDGSVEAEFVVDGKAEASVNAPFQFAELWSPTALIVGDEDWVRQMKTLLRDQPRTLRPVLYASKLEALPDNGFAYDAIDTIILDQGEWTRLISAQAGALRAYVEGGGNLVVSSGRNASSVANSPLAELIPVRIEDTAQITQLIRPIPNVSPIRSDKTLLLARASAKTNAVLRVFGQDNARPLVAETPLGLGRVTFLAFQLGEPVLREWPDKTYLWQFLFARKFAPTIETRGSDFDRKMNVALETNTLLSIPTANQIGLLLLAYVVGVIPLNHLFWRLVRRPLWAWGALPVVSLGLGATMIINERIVTQGNLSLTEILIAHGQSGRPTVVADSFLSLQSGFVQRFGVRGTNATVGWLPIFSPGTERNFGIQAAAQPPQFHFDVLRKDTAAFRGEHTVPLGQGIDLRVEWKQGNLSGQVFNRTGLTFLQSGFLGPIAGSPQVEIISDAKLAGARPFPTHPGDPKHIEEFIKSTAVPAVDARQQVVFWALASGSPLELDLRYPDERKAVISREVRWTLLLFATPFHLSDGPFEIAGPHWRSRVIAVRYPNAIDAKVEGLLGADVSDIHWNYSYPEFIFEARPDVDLSIDPSVNIQRLVVEVDCKCSYGYHRELYNHISRAWENVPDPIGPAQAWKYLHPRRGTILVRLLEGGTKEAIEIKISVAGQRQSQGPPA